MKAKSTSLSVILSLALLSIVLVALAQATTIIVNPDENIQHAIDRAQPGDVIEVLSGIYKECLTVDTPNLTLLGICSGDDLPILQAISDCSAITINANKTTLECFEIRGAYSCELSVAGVMVNSNDNIIVNNSIYDNIDPYGFSTLNGCGVFLRGGDNTIICNSIRNNTVGMVVLSDNNVITKNVIIDNYNSLSRDAIGVILSGSNNVMEDNVMDNNNVEDEGADNIIIVRV